MTEPFYVWHYVWQKPLGGSVRHVVKQNGTTALCGLMPKRGWYTDLTAPTYCKRCGIRLANKHNEKKLPE